MPRVRPLTKEQSARWRQQELCKEIMERVGERKGLYDFCDADVAEMVGLSPTAYSHLKKEGLLNRKFDIVLKLVHFAGYELKLEKIEDKAPKKQVISAKKGDTYGTIIEGLIRQIVQETMNQDK